MILKASAKPAAIRNVEKASYQSGEKDRERERGGGERETDWRWESVLGGEDKRLLVETVDCTERTKHTSVGLRSRWGGRGETRGAPLERGPEPEQEGTGETH